MVRLLVGDAREQLATLEAESVHCAITSPPYWGLRAYGTTPQTWGGDPACEHQWESERYYRAGGASVGSHEAFSVAGPDNAARLKETRWRDDTRCSCGAWRGELGAEPTPEMFVDHLVGIFREVKRVLRADGTLWLNMGDCYNAGTTAGRNPSPNNDVGYWNNGGTMGDRRCKAPGLKTKDLVGMPWMLAFALRADGWYLRSDIIWAKGNPMPASVTDRPTTAHEYLFLLTKQPRYFYDATAIREKGVCPKGTRGAKGSVTRAAAGVNARPPEYKVYNGTRNKRSVWTINTAASGIPHYATFPAALVRPCVLAGCPPGGTVLDCFGGVGTTAAVAHLLGRDAISIDLDPASLTHYPTRLAALSKAAKPKRVPQEQRTLPAMEEAP